MKILITGCCGFVGSELASQLREWQTADTLQLIGLDNLCRNGSWRNRERLTKLDVSITHGDIRNQADVEAIGDVDWVIDAAANPSVLAGVDGKSSSRQLVDHNLAGTVNLLEHCKQFAAGFILLSTSRVYSIPPLAGIPVVESAGAYSPQPDYQHPGLTTQGISEDFPTTPPVSLYGSTKLASEQLALEYGACFDFPVWINRCGVMAGAGQFGKADQGIFPFWLHSWKENCPLKYIGFGGCGYQVRDCLHPRDLAPLLKLQLEATSQSDDKPVVINVSGGLQSAMSLSQLSDWCSDRWGHREVPGDDTPRKFDLPWVVLDHTQATKAWDWRPATSAETILTEIADFADTQSDWIEFSR